MEEIALTIQNLVGDNIQTIETNADVFCLKLCENVSQYRKLRSTIVSSGVVIFFLSQTLQTQGVRNSVVGWQHESQKIKEHQ
jgi:hypothetical protein